MLNFTFIILILIFIFIITIFVIIVIVIVIIIIVTTIIAINAILLLLVSCSLVTAVGQLLLGLCTLLYMTNCLSGYYMICIKIVHSNVCLFAMKLLYKAFMFFVRNVFISVLVAGTCPRIKSCTVTTSLISSTLLSSRKYS